MSNEHQNLQGIERRLITIERLLRDLLKEKKLPKETWVKVSTIMELTGWNNEEMRRARNNNFVKVKREKGKGIWYSLESISDTFIKKS